MKKIKMKFKKGITKLLALTMIASMSQNLAGIEQVAASNGAKSYSFVEKADLIGLQEGKIIFGKNEDGKAQEWYLVGTDNKVSGENVVIVAAKPIKASQVFENEGKRNKKDSALWKDCSYENSSSITEVHPNHYGASDLRAELKKIENDEKYFSSAQAALLNTTKVTTEDTRNRVSYVTEDKLYVLANVNGKLMAGSNDSIEVKTTEKAFFWLRTVQGLMDSKGDSLTANNKNKQTSASVEFNRAVLPASNLNISRVLFASTASSARTGKLDNDIPMILRFDGSEKTFADATYDKATGNIKVNLNTSVKNPVSLIVVGEDWAFSTPIEENAIVTVETIQKALDTKSDISLDECKVWVEEANNTEGIVYAKMAVEGEVPDAQTPDGDGDKPGEDDNKPNEDGNKPSGDDSKPSEDDNKPNGNDNKSESSTTGTGDTTPTIILIAIATVSMIIIIATFYLRGKQR